MVGSAYAYIFSNSTVSQLRTNEYMAEHFVSEAEFGLMGDQLKTMTPTVLARYSASSHV